MRLSPREAVFLNIGWHKRECKRQQVRKREKDRGIRGGEDRAHKKRCKRDKGTFQDGIIQRYLEFQ